MSSSENLLKAALNRISIRYGQRLFKTATHLSKKAKEAPDQVKAEWELLKEEIANEANRLENNSKQHSSEEDQKETSHKKISSIRAKISILINKVEDQN